MHIQVIEEEGVQANAGKIGDIFITELMKLREEFEVVGDVRGKGLMLGMELVKNKVREEEGEMEEKEGKGEKERERERERRERESVCVCDRAKKRSYIHVHNY